MADKPILAQLTSDEPIRFEQAAEVDGKAGPPTFTAAPAYSGSIVSGATASPRLPHDYVIDLTGTKVAKSAKVNLDHKSNQRVGHITDFANDGTSLVMTGALSAKTAFRDEVAQSATDQYPWNVSIEGALSQREFIPDGKSAVVNGREVSGPLFVFRKAVISELAFCSRGADEGNAVTIAASAAGEKHMNEFEQYVVANGLDPATLNDELRATLKAGHEAKLASCLTPEKKSFAEAAAEVRREQKRRDAIQEMALNALKDNPEFQESIINLTNAALEDPKTDMRDYQLALIRIRPNAGSFGVGAARPNHNDPKLVEAALAASVGIDIEKDRSYGPQVAEAVDRSRLRSFSLQQLLMETAHANGYTCRAGEKITQGNLREVLQYCFPPVVQSRLAGGFSTASLPNILGAVANKQILMGYMEEDDTWREIAEIKNVSNFYTQNHYRMLDSLEYEEVGSGGELKHGTLGEESYTTKAKTYGKMLGLTREQIINDDLGAFNDLRTRLGRGAAKKFNNVFWAAFINNSTFFTSALTNYIEGSTTNLGLDGVGLELGIKAARQMTSPSADGTKKVGVGFRPTKLLVPPELEFIAQRLYVSMNVNTGGAASATSVPDANIHVNKYRPIVQNRLSDSSYTGYSTTAWYLFGDDMKPMAVSFLNGQQAPTVESTDADFSTLGILWRGYHDFGCDKSEYLSGVKSKGAT